MAPDPLSLAVAAIRKWLSAYTAEAWRKSPGVTETDMQVFAARMAPTVAASQMKVANLVASKVAHDYGIPPLPVDEELITHARGVDPVEVYARPIITTRTALSEGKTFDEARNLGLVRARQLCLTDVQMAKVRQTDQSLTAGGAEYFRRVPQGPATCALCLIAATQPYKVGKLMPIHPGCDCGVEAIPAGMNLDHLLDTKALLSSTHAKVKKFASIEDAGGRAVDYRKLLITKEHGEIGPLLAWNGQAFTGPKDIPGPADVHSAKPTVTKIEDETPADRARKLLPGLESSLANLRAKGLSEDSPQVTYHQQQINKHAGALADEAAKSKGPVKSAPVAARKGVDSATPQPQAGAGGGGNRIPPDRAQRTGFDAPDEYPKLPDGTKVPFTPQDAPMPSAADISRVLQKHQAGANVPNKSEFPASWTKTDIQNAIELTIKAPDQGIQRSGDKITFERDVDGTKVRVHVRTDTPKPTFWSAYPVAE